MDEITARCDVYNMMNGTNLTPHQYYSLSTDVMVENEREAVAKSADMGLTTSLIKNINRKIMSRR